PGAAPACAATSALARQTPARPESRVSPVPATVSPLPATVSPTRATIAARRRDPARLAVVSSPEITLTARHSPSALDIRRGVVRLHPEVLAALGLRQWDAVRLTGARISSALAAEGDHRGPTGVLLLDDVTMSNLGIMEGAEVVVAPVQVS